MIIVAGHLTVDPDDRETYLRAVEHVTVRARRSSGCLDFVQAPDPIDPTRIVVYERWESDESLDRFRSADDEPAAAGAAEDVPEITGGDVHRYRISAVEPA